MLSDKLHNASSTKRGFTFQDCASIVLFLDHVKDVESIRVEGEKEDIELNMKDGTKIFSQCKTCKIDNWDKDYKRCFSDALRTMSESDDDNCSGLIYTTNIVRPLGSHSEQGEFLSEDRWIKYNELSSKSRTVADSIIQDSGFDIDTDKLSFRIIGFIGETEKNKTKVVLDNIRSFIGRARLRQTVDVDSLFSLWLDIISFNSSDENTSNFISKKHIIWLFIGDQMDEVAPYSSDWDIATEDELKPSYNSLINQYVERVDFVSKVLADFSEWSEDKPRGQTTCDDFVKSSWQLYKEDLRAPDLSPEYQELLITMILRKIINLREFIRKIKEATDL